MYETIKRLMKVKDITSVSKKKYIKKCQRRSEKSKSLPDALFLMSTAVLSVNNHNRRW